MGQHMAPCIDAIESSRLCGGGLGVGLLGQTRFRNGHDSHVHERTVKMTILSIMVDFDPSF